MWQQLTAISIGVPVARTACSAAGGADVPDEDFDLISIHNGQRQDALRVRFCKKKICLTKTSNDDYCTVHRTAWDNNTECTLCTQMQR